jgi:hypothetical protein
VREGAIVVPKEDLSHRALGLTHILVEQLRTLDRDEIETLRVEMTISFGTGTRSSMRSLAYEPHSLAMALARSVFPQPGGPKRSTPMVDDKPCSIAVRTVQQ